MEAEVVIKIADNIISPLGSTTAENYQAILSGRSELRFYEGLSLQEAALALGTNVNTLNTRLRKAKSLLQAKLEGWYYDEED